MGVKNLTTINGHLVDEVKEKPCIFEACLCGSLYSTFTTSFSLQFSSIIRLFHIILVEKKNNCENFTTHMHFKTNGY